VDSVGSSSNQELNVLLRMKENKSYNDGSSDVMRKESKGKTKSKGISNSS